MKLLVITLPLTLAASLAWSGTILNTTNNLNPPSIAHAIAYAIEQPAEVEIDEIVVRPTAQDF